MSKEALRVIKEAVDAEEYLTALEKCDVMLKDGADSLEPQERFLLFSTKGHVCIQLAKVDLGEKALLEASKLITKDIPQPQVQKLYKLLGDLYEKTSKWDSYASFTTKLYDMVVEKGNFERAETLSVAIGQAYSKCKSLKVLEEGCRYINACFRNQKCKKSAKNTQALVSSYGLILDIVHNEKAKAAARSISDKKTSSEEEEWRSPDAAIECLHTVLVSEPSALLSEPADKGLLSIVNRYLQKARKSVFANKTSWDDMLKACQQAKVIIKSSEELVTLYLECYAFGASGALPDLMLLSDDMLASNTSNLVTDIVKAFYLLKRGLYMDALPYVDKCMEHWKAKPEMPTSKSKQKLSSNSIPSEDIILTLCVTIIVLASAYTEFHFSLVFDTLHFVEEAGRRCQHLHSRFDLFQGKMIYLTQVCKFIAYCSVGQKKHAHTQLLDLLKAVNQNDNDKIPLQLLHRNDAGDDQFELAINENFDFSSDLSDISCFMTLLLLRNLKNYDLSIHLGNKMSAMDTAESARSVFAEVEVLWCKTLQQIVNYSCAQIERRSKLSPISSEILLIECDLSNYDCCQDLSDILTKFQALIMKKDDVDKNGDLKTRVRDQLELVIKYRRCLLMWILGGTHRSDKNAMFASLLEIAKKYPRYGLTYTLLGHYYAEISNDLARAEKCYLRSLTCNAMDSEAGYALSRLYLHAGGVAESSNNAETLWNNIIEQTASHSFWALNLKAHYNMQQGGEKLQDAIEAFRKAVEIDEDCGPCLFGLGYCYSKQQSNTAALKSLSRAMKIIPNNDVVETTLAEVERRLGMFDECLLKFKGVLSRSPIDLVALKGVGDSCIILAYRYISMGWSRGAANMIIEGIECIEKALRLCSNDDERKVFNLLLGEFCNFSRLLSPLDFKDDCFSSHNTSTFCDYTPIIELLERGKIAYESLLESDTSGNTLYSIGCLLYLKAMATMFSRGQGCGITSTSMLIDPEVKEVIDEAKKTFIRGIELQPEHGGCWNGLGLCWLDDPYERQVCFTQAVKLGENHAGLTNMGVTSLFHGYAEDAKTYFNELQGKAAVPEVWISIGHAFEQQATKDTYASSMKSASDAYYAAIEVNKPVEALLSTAVICMKTRGYFKELESDVEKLFSLPDLPQQTYSESKGKEREENIVEPSDKIELESEQTKEVSEVPTDSSEKKEADQSKSEESLLLEEILKSHCPTCAFIEVLHTIKHRLHAYLYRRPVHPFAWNIFAWASERLGCYREAKEAYFHGLKALKNIESFVRTVNREGEEYEAANKKIEIYRMNFQTAIERCDKSIAAGEAATKVGGILQNLRLEGVDSETTYETIVEMIWSHVKETNQKYKVCISNGKLSDSVMSTDIISNYVCMGCFVMNSNVPLSLCVRAKESFPEKFMTAVSREVSDSLDVEKVSIECKREIDGSENIQDEEGETALATMEIEVDEEEFEKRRDIEARKKASRFRKNAKKIEIFPGEDFLNRKLVLKEFFKNPIEGQKWMDILKVEN